MRGASEKAATIMMASLSESTLKQYNKAIQCWWEFCHREDLSPFEYSVPHIMNFFIEVYEKVNSYSTMNTYRSAISLLMSNDLGRDARVLRFFKGISVLKPPRPRYSTTWDPGPVLDCVASLYPNESLSLENLTKKVVTLLALITAQRVQTLSKVRIEYISYSPKLIQIRVPDRIKTSGIGRDQPLLNIPFFEEKPSLCVALTLQHYIKRTASLRPQDSSLFITFKKPYKTASSQSISRWIRQVLGKSGIDTSVFKAHSTRHAPTSAALRNGANIESIRQAAGWTKNSSVFGRFYNRLVVQSVDFASAILNSKISQ